jgi:hypothetical protein
MKMFGALFEALDREPSQDIPVGRLERVRQSLRRRLSDQLEDVLHRACVENDLLTAEGLLTVLEDLQHRRQQIYGRERRINDEGIVKARNAVVACRERNPTLAELSKAQKSLNQALIGGEVTAAPLIAIETIGSVLPADFFADPKRPDPILVLHTGYWANPLNDGKNPLSRVD